MPQFVYSITDNRKPEAVGLSYAFDKAPMAAETVGPGGVMVRVYSSDPDAFPGTNLDRFDWVEISEGVHVGCDRFDKPSPTDLEREATVDGELVELVDGHWHVPRLRAFTEGEGYRVALPKRASWKNGEWYIGEVLPEHATADALAEELLDRMLPAEGHDASRTMNDAEALDYVSRILRVNYRVSQPELSLLGSLPIDQRLIEIIHIATDFPKVIEHALGKAQAPDASPPTSGDGG